MRCEMRYFLLAILMAWIIVSISIMREITSQIRRQGEMIMEIHTWTTGKNFTGTVGEYVK